MSHGLENWALFRRELELWKLRKSRIYRDVTNARVSSPHLALVDDRDQRRLDDTPAPSFLRIDSTRIFW